MKSFLDYKEENYKWITSLEGEYFPDYLDQARVFYKPVIKRFRELALESTSSVEFFTKINTEPGNSRIQLMRIFRKYTSPETSVEMLKVKGKESKIIEYFGGKFRDIKEVQKILNQRKDNDEALIAILYEYKDRGKKGYSLTGMFFEWFEAKFPVTDESKAGYRISGPTGAGKDIILDSILKGYPKRTPADFVIWSRENEPLIIGFARYDSDRGGAQEDDRIKGYSDNVTDILSYSKKFNKDLKILFLNEGPGLLLGSMWSDYGELETRSKGKVMVITGKMLEERLTGKWIES
ncbi:MAG: hypothetical protein AAB547_01170 [Patescibacteria group bacterium]